VTDERVRELRSAGEGAPHGRRPLDYEPPRVERVLSPDDLHREVLYAGVDGRRSGPTG
jgi:hypothetical protein